ncbi:hypothetical protein HFN59_02265 [Rhizobium leguminosarum]|uniref:hypothetical protein n=1 Tax=Rhizobium leguminosarum TaxID=384 RepID=UPI001C93FE6F|nr:hypothetical protein [Rhizobium leguminosarum]MBY5775948.1 hypothetical protein [Rhizobium leguminosarum]
MAPRKPKPTTAAAVIPDPATEQPAMTNIANPVSVAGMTPRKRDDIAIRDAVRKALAETEAMVGDFIAGQTAEGFSLAEIDQLYVLELPLMRGYRVEGGRIRAQFDAQITERQS